MGCWSKYVKSNSINSLVINRCILLISLLINMCLNILFIGDFLPIKYEEWKGDVIYVHIWKCCIWFNRPMIPYTDPEIEKCYYNVYTENYEAWFTSIQVQLGFAALLSIFSFIYSICMFIFTKNAANRRLWIPGWCLLLASSFMFMSLIIYENYFPFDQIGDIREMGIGWTEEIEHNEMYGENYYFIWACFCVSTCVSILTFVVARKDRYYAKHSDQARSVREAQVFYRHQQSQSRDKLLRSSSGAQSYNDIQAVSAGQGVSYRR